MEDHTPLPLCYHIVVTQRDPAGSASGPREIFPSERKQKQMKIVLINAAAPDYYWKKRYTPSVFAREYAAYAAARIKPDALGACALSKYF